MIEIYGTPDCNYCVQAKAFCIQKNMQFKYVDLTVDDVDIDALIEALGGKFPKTVPQIFDDGQYVGGFYELVRHASGAKHA